MSTNAIPTDLLKAIDAYRPTLDTAGAQVIVLRRYEKTDSRPEVFGLHVIAPSEDEGIGGFEHHVLGLADEDISQAIINQLIDDYGAPSSIRWSATEPDVAQFIHSQVIPMEWKQWTPAQYDDAITVLGFPDAIVVPVLPGPDEVLPEHQISSLDADGVNNLFGFVTDKGTRLFEDATWSCVTPVEGLRLNVRVRVDHEDYDPNQLEGAEQWLRGTCAALNAMAEPFYGEVPEHIAIPSAYMQDLLDAAGRVVAAEYPYEDLVAMAKFMTTSIHGSVAQLANAFLHYVLKAA